MSYPASFKLSQSFIEIIAKNFSHTAGPCNTEEAIRRYKAIVFNISRFDKICDLLDEQPGLEDLIDKSFKQYDEWGTMSMWEITQILEQQQ